MLIIYHSRDLDGICSGAILKQKYKEARMMGYHYGEPFNVNEIIDEGEMVWMTDVSLPMEKMEEIARRAGKFVWIDHHVSAYNDYSEHFHGRVIYAAGMTSTNFGNFHYIYDNTKAACEGCWNYCWDNPVPAGVLLLGRYDTWRQDEGDWENGTLPFQWGMRLEGYTVDTFPSWMLDTRLDIPHQVVSTTEVGKTILKYQDSQNRKMMEISSFEAKVKFGQKKLNAICCMGVPFNSQSFKSVYDTDKHDVMIPIGWKPGRGWGCSFYTTHDDVDCSLIAKQFGGGGHKKAAGCRVEDINELLEF